MHFRIRNADFLRASLRMFMSFQLISLGTFEFFGLRSSWQPCHSGQLDLFEHIRSKILGNEVKFCCFSYIYRGRQLIFCILFVSLLSHFFKDCTVVYFALIWLIFRHFSAVLFKKFWICFNSFM